MSTATRADRDRAVHALDKIDDLLSRIDDATRDLVTRLNTTENPGDRPTNHR